MSQDIKRDIIDISGIKVCRCPACLEVKDLEDFIPNSPYCLKCRFARQKKSLHNRRQVLRSYMDKLVSDTKADKIEAPHVTEVLALLLKQFDGGVLGWIQQYYDDLQTTRSKYPGSAAVMRAHESITKLIKWSTEHRESAPDVHGMTDEQIKDELASVMLQRLMEGGADGQKEFLDALDGMIINGDATESAEE